MQTMPDVPPSKRRDAASDPPRNEPPSIVVEEERVLRRVHRAIEARARRIRQEAQHDYDAELLSLRDQIQEARLEDVPPLIEEMERLQRVAARRAQVTESTVDPRSPYFGRMLLEEEIVEGPGSGEVRKREVLIGRGTLVDARTGLCIVDWRDAPVSRLYYRYDEGDEYDEVFGDREVEGLVLLRRAVSISEGKLRRVTAPQGTFVRAPDGAWRFEETSASLLRGGQGSALRPEAHHRPGRLGTGHGDLREDKHLSEITALIDPRQFELISRPDSGLVVIQGGAGSGKTTIGLHRLAWLAYQDPRRFRPKRMLVVVFNDALVRYIERVLPALGVEGVPVVTYGGWARRLRCAHYPEAPKEQAEDTPAVVTRLKKHPIMLRRIDQVVAEVTAALEEEAVATLSRIRSGGLVLRAWRRSDSEPLGVRLELLRRWLDDPEGEARTLTLPARHAAERLVAAGRRRLAGRLELWAEALTDRDALRELLAHHASPDAFSARDLEWAVTWCARRCARVQEWVEEAEERAERVSADPEGLDGAPHEEPAALDPEDDTLLLRLHQRLVGPLRRHKEALRYTHLFVDEAQDLSPVELAVVLDTANDRRSVTLAGDVAQRMLMDNGFVDWKQTLEQLGLEHVAVEPLQLSYRSTHEILEVARAVLGPLAEQASGYRATRHGAPVELFRFAGAGEAVGFLAEALKDLACREPNASVAVVARYPEQADRYFDGLRHGLVPNLRRIAEQDFSFTPGVDVTDVRQVKGLEFDYVVLVECSTASYPEDDESRHLLHIAVTRAAHQLWVLSTGTPSRLLPEELLARARG